MFFCAHGNSPNQNFQQGLPSLAAVDDVVLYHQTTGISKTVRFKRRGFGSHLNKPNRHNSWNKKYTHCQKTSYFSSRLLLSTNFTSDFSCFFGWGYDVWEMWDRPALQDMTLWRSFDWILCLEVGEHVPKQCPVRTVAAAGAGGGGGKSQNYWKGRLSMVMFFFLV